MATVKPVVANINDDAVKVQWRNIASGDTCEEYSGFSDYSDRSVQVEAAAFGGATITIAGSNDGDNYQTLTDPSGTAITASSAKLRQILEYVWKVKPTISGGDVTTNITVTIVAKRSRR